MKRIVWTGADGVCKVFHPAEGARLAYSVTLAGVIVASSEAGIAVWMLLRPWPMVGAVAEWAESEDEFLSRLAEKVVPAGVTDTVFIDPADLPVDRTFRESWSLAGSIIESDMAKAREIWRDKMRVARALKFILLDDAMKPFTGKVHANGVLSPSETAVATVIEDQRIAL